MVLTVALISLAVLAAPAEPQSAPPDQPPAYTLSGVRRASVPAPAPSTEPVPSAPLPSKPLTHSAGQRLNVESPPRGTPVPLPHDDRFVTASLGPLGPGWHQEFIGMTMPQEGSTPFGLMTTNGDRAVGMATSMAFALAIQEAVGLVGKLVGSYHEWKVSKLRKEIDAERLVMEQLYQASQNSGPDASPIKKRPD